MGAAQSELWPGLHQRSAVFLVFRTGVVLRVDTGLSEGLGREQAARTLAISRGGCAGEFPDVRGGILLQTDRSLLTPGRRAMRDTVGGPAGAKRRVSACKRVSCLDCAMYFV